METYWPILTYFFLCPLFLLGSIALTVINTFSASLFDLCVGWIDPGTFGAALTLHLSRHSGSSIALSCLTTQSSSASQSPSLSYRFSNSPFQSSQFSVSEMLSGAVSCSLSAGWWSLVVTQWTFNTWIHPPRRCFAGKAGEKGNLSDNFNAATLSCWRFD